LVLKIFWNILAQPYRPNYNFSHLPQTCINYLSLNKPGLDFAQNGSLFLALRALLFIEQQHVTQKQKKDEADIEVSVALSQTSKAHLAKFQSFGWLTRFLESGDSRVRTMVWDLLAELFDYNLLKQQPSILQVALRCYLQDKESFNVKVSCLKFINKMCDALIHNCEITRSNNSKDELSQSEFVGSFIENISVQSLL